MTGHPTARDMLPALLADRASAAGDDVCVVEAETGESVTFGQLALDASRMAGGLRELGVGAGDLVATMLPHSADTYRIWFALAMLGAAEVPVGTRYRGLTLTHLLEDSGVTVAVVDAAHASVVLELLRSGDAAGLKTVVVRGGTDLEAPPGVALVSLEEVRVATRVRSHVEATPRDLALVLYTSGTTGVAKGVLVPWGQVHATVTGVFPEGTCRPGKVLYGPFPPNHIGGRLFVGMGINYGLPAVVRDTFSASAYWRDVATHGATTTALVSAMVAILSGAAPRDDDRDNSLEDVLMNPLTSDYREFEERFGLRVCTDFNMTETSIPLHSGWEIDDWRSCGRVRPGAPGYELELVDEFDVPVAVGEVGELICRTRTPWTLNAGYLGRPEESAVAWRNGWFHTGDAFRRDEQGRYYFVDRIKDAIRRRGENISSFEVEREVLSHPEVLECAAIGVPSPIGEQDVKVFVVRSVGSTLTEADLIHHVRQRAPGFMVPEHVEFVADLPKTEATQKVMKAQLRTFPSSTAAGEDR